MPTTESKQLTLRLTHGAIIIIVGLTVGAVLLFALIKF